MDTLARKIIDAIQNSLVGDLVAQLVWPYGYLWAMLTSEVISSETYGPVFFGWLIVALLGASLAWLLGTTAKKTTHLHSTKHLSDRVTRQPENGFETWSCPPAGGLRPPVFMRQIVTWLGGSMPGSKPKSRWLSLALFIGMMLMAVSVAWVPGFWADINPVLGLRSARIIFVQACYLVLVALVVRHWATDQKNRLAKQDEFSASSAMSLV